ncbi:hypothetical protein GCM10027053_03870 [Intrasporangium mesophilum]
MNLSLMHYVAGSQKQADALAELKPFVEGLPEDHIDVRLAFNKLYDALNAAGDAFGELCLQIDLSCLRTGLDLYGKDIEPDDGKASS